MSAMPRRDRSPIPPSAKVSISASSSCLRRSTSGGRATHLLAARLEAPRLELEVALGGAAHEPTDERADEALLVEPLAHPRAAAIGGDLVHRDGPATGRALFPGP